MRFYRISSEKVYGWLALAALGAISAWLRTQQLYEQVLIDDEWHALHAVLRLNYAEILANFGLADRSIPLTLLYQAMADTIGLNELRMRLPSLLAGFATIAIGIAWTWRRFGRGVALVFGWLLGTAPLLVIYSRAARPYALVVMLTMVAFWAAHIWWYGRRQWALWLYAASVALGSWLHPLFGPLLLSPLFFFGCEALCGRRRMASPWLDLPRLCRGGLVVGVLSAPPVIYPFISHPAAILDKAGAGKPSAATLGELAYFLAGTSYEPIVVVFFSLAILGAVVATPKFPRYAAFGAMASTVLACTLLIARPAWMSTGYVLARYALPVLPGVLLLVSLAIVALAKAVPPPAAIRAGAVLVMCAILMLGTPLAKTWEKPVSYGLHTYYIADFGGGLSRTDGFLEAMPRSPFWQNKVKNLGEPDTPLFLAPWRFEAPLSPLPVLEKKASRRILPAFIDGYCASHRYGEVPAEASGVNLHNALHLSSISPMPQRDRYLIWKRRWHIDPKGERALARMGLFVAPLREKLPQCERRLRRDFGSPIYEDRWLAVYSLSGKSAAKDE